MEELLLKPLYYVWYAVRCFIIVASNFYAIPAYCVWLLVLWPLRFIYWELFWKIETVLFKGLLTIVATWLYSGGYKIYESGDDISSLYNEPVLVLCNHQSTADTLVMMTTMHGKGLVGGRLMWIMDYIFKVTHFGWVSILRGDFFIQQGKEGRSREIERLGSYLKTNFAAQFKKWLVLFPEGGFLRKRREASQRYALLNDLPVLNHVTLPRTGAMQVIMDSITSQKRNPHNPEKRAVSEEPNSTLLRWVIDITVAYPQGHPLDLQGIMIGYWPSCKVLVHYRAYPLTDLPSKSEELTKWLYDLYEEKDSFLDHYYKYNVVPNSDCPKRSLPRRKDGIMQVDALHMFLFHVFYVISAYLQITYIIRPLLSLLF